MKFNLKLEEKKASNFYGSLTCLLISLGDLGVQGEATFS